MFGTYVGNGLMLVAPKWGGRLLMPADDLHLTPFIIVKGVHEAGLTNWIISNIKKGMTVVDVGASVGYFTTLLGYVVGYSGRVIAFEPHPGTLEILKKNMVMNYTKDWVEINEVAVGDSRSKTTLEWGTGEDCSASIHTPRFHLQGSQVSKVEVDVVTLDEMIPDKVDFIKIDVEGNEHRALKGAGNVLKRGCMVAFELNRKRLRTDHEKLIALLGEYETLGATFSVPTGEGGLEQISLNQVADIEFHNSVFMEVPPCQG